MSVVDVMQRYVRAVRAGDFETAMSMFADDVVLHIPGRSALAGGRRGRDVAVAYIRAARALSEGHEVEVDVIDMLTSEERFALVVRERFQLDDRTVDINRANVYRVRGDEICEISIFEANQYEVDELFAGARSDRPGV